MHQTQTPASPPAEPPPHGHKFRQHRALARRLEKQTPDHRSSVWVGMGLPEPRDRRDEASLRAASN